VTEQLSWLAASLQGQVWAALLLASATALLVVAPGFHEALWPLTWVALVPLVLALRHATPGRAFLLGWWTETLIVWLAFYWLVGTMVRYGLLSVPLSLFLFALIGIGNGVRLGLFAWWVRLAGAIDGPWWYCLLLPAGTYVALDSLFPRVFPWYLGATQLRALPLIQVADLTGVHGVTFLLVATSTVVAAFFPHPLRPTAAARGLMRLVLALLLLLDLGYGLWRLPQITAAMQQAPSLRLALLQPNIGIDEKENPAHQAGNLRAQVEMSRATLTHRPDLILWPETMYPCVVPRHTTHLAVPPLPHHPHTHWLIGALTLTHHNAEPHLFNSALLVASDARLLGQYDKQRLLPFGEYIPLQRYFPFLRDLSPTIGNLTPGAGGVLTLPNGVALGPLICYEDILPALGRQASRQGAQVLINLTNDAWFGQTRAPAQHRLLAAFRAIENRVFLVRVTNTGLTSIIDARGREQATVPLNQRDTLVHTIPLLRVPSLYTRFGNWFAQLCSAAAVCLPLLRWDSRRQWAERR
jgi:apolipoprotein N-acyltransferase